MSILLREKRSRVPIWVTDLSSTQKYIKSLCRNYYSPSSFEEHVFKNMNINVTVGGNLSKVNMENPEKPGKGGRLCGFLLSTKHPASN